MAAEPPPPSAAQPPPRRRGARLALGGLVVGGVLAVLVVAGAAWLSTEHALRTVVAFAVERTGGKLAVEGASGSLTGTVHAARLRWRDQGLAVDADDVTIRFSPWRLVTGHVAITEARVRHLALALARDEAPATLPESLALPLAIDIERLAVGTIAWQRGAQSGTLRDLVAAYRGDASGHRISDFSIAAPSAQLAGDASVRAQRPFAVAAKLAFDLAAPHPAGRVAAQLEGSLADLRVAATSTLGGIAADAKLRLAPFAAQPLVDGSVHARSVDLAALAASWPTTRLDVDVTATPTASGFAGKLAARNHAAGPLDRSRVPIATLASAFSLAGRTLVLDDLVAQFPGGGRASGRGTIDVEGWQHRWTLAIAALDLAQLHSALIDTRLAGSVQADVDGSAQRVVADVAQDDLALAFAATYDGRVLIAERFTAQARGGTLAGNGRVELAGARPFVLAARAQRFDPARFGAFPAGSLDGEVRAQGQAAGTPSAQADIVIAKGSTLVGLPAEGRVRGRFTTTAAEGLDARLTLGASRLAAQGAVNRNAPLAFDFASSRLAELGPLLPQDLPALAGALEARGRLEPAAKGTRFTIAARGRKLRVGETWSFGSLTVDASGWHAGALTRPRVETLDELAVTLAATDAAAPQGELAQAKLTLTGSAAAHALAVEASDQSRKLAARVSGALAGLPATPAWRGRVLALALEGLPGLDRAALAGPATLEVAAGRVTLGAARLEGNGTRVEVAGLDWNAGRLTTGGRFTGLPLAAAAKAAGVELPWPTDLVLGGRWDIDAAPQWRGSVAVARERGDVYVEDVADSDGSRLALGLRTLALDAAIEGSRMHVTGELQARLQGTALLDATVQAGANALHPFAADARLAGTLRAHVPSLATLQPWIGTAARVQGQAIAEINLGGTLGDPGFTGQLVGYDLRIDMPQHGVHLADGRLRIVSSAEGLRLEEFVFAGGDGSFTASGTIALPLRERGDESASRIAWRARDFRALNHPDRRLVLDGEGTLARRAGRWVLAGRVAIDEGRIAWRSTADTKLDDDIVVVGRPRPQRDGPDAGGAAPIDLDLAIEFGRDFRFTAEGLDTRLAGKLSVTSRRGEPMIGRGTIRTAQGTYEAFGQRLTIDRGRLIFDGPLGNPALDIVALRRNLAVEAGVAITGTARAPLVRLTSNPPVPDNEKLSWLLTGGPPGTATQREMLALQAAQAALVGRGGQTLTQQFARNLGLDDISFVNRGGGNAEDPFAGQVVSVGKRITDRLYVSFEQGLAIATNALRIEYVLSRYFTVSAFAGTTSGVELRFRRNWR